MMFPILNQLIMLLLKTDMECTELFTKKLLSKADFYTGWPQNNFGVWNAKYPLLPLLNKKKVLNVLYMNLKLSSFY